jgi:beta-phosphoglucomutase-like phosphatase (HAD superfamily)
VPYPHQITSTSFTLPPGEFGAYIFDCDGTLVDSMPLHLHAWRAALEQHGFDPEEFTYEMHHKYAGMPGVAIVNDLNKRFSVNLDPHQVEADKVVWYLSHHDEVGPVAPVAEFARANFGKIPMAVASGSDRKLVELSLEALGLSELFPVIITPENVAPGRGKPAPDMFLLAAEKLGIVPERCLVFEDGHLGMQAAAAANMAAVWVAV